MDRTCSLRHTFVNQIYSCQSVSGFLKLATGKKTVFHSAFGAKYNNSQPQMRLFELQPSIAIIDEISDI